jgi:hypothetical protein
MFGGASMRAFQRRICKFERCLSGSELGARSINIQGWDMSPLPGSEDRGSMWSSDGPVPYIRVGMAPSVDPDDARDTVGGEGSD